MKILFKITTRSRPANAIRAVHSILSNVDSNNFEILISVDEDDYPTIEKLNVLAPHSQIRIIKGVSKNKVDAINRDMDKAGDWDILVNVSDDQVFTEKGFDTVIRESFITLDECLHFPDGNTKELITMAIMGRKYYERFNYIYHPEYVSLWCDNEMMEVAKKLSCYRFVNQNIFLHLHPAFGKAPNDLQYMNTESYYRIDEQTFLKRKANNFGL